MGCFSDKEKKERTSNNEKRNETNSNNNNNKFKDRNDIAIPVGVQNQIPNYPNLRKETLDDDINKYKGPAFIIWNHQHISVLSVSWRKRTRISQICF